VKENGIELEIREHSDADFFPERCPGCKESAIKRFTYHVKELQELGTPFTCRRIFYERVYFKCNECGKVFTIEHPFIPINAKYMPSVVKYAVSRVLDKGDSVRRVAQDLNEFHLVKVSVSTVQRWVNEEGKRNELPVDFSNEKPPENFSGFLSLDGTFKPVKLKKNSQKLVRRKAGS